MNGDLSRVCIPAGRDCGKLSKSAGLLVGSWMNGWWNDGCRVCDSWRTFHGALLVIRVRCICLSAPCELNPDSYASFVTSSSHLPALFLTLLPNPLLSCLLQPASSYSSPLPPPSLFLPLSPSRFSPGRPVIDTYKLPGGSGIVCDPSLSSPARRRFVI